MTLESATRSVPTLSTYSSDSPLASDSVVSLSFIPLTVSLSFSEAMDTSSISTDNISLSCEETIEITITTAEDSDDIENNEFTITPSVPISQLATCTLSASINILSASGVALEEEGSFSFSTPCASGNTLMDEFTTQNTISGDSSCWYYAGPEDLSLVPSGNLANVVEEGEILISYGDTTSDGPAVGFIRQAMTAENLTMIMKITDFTGFEDKDNSASAGWFTADTLVATTEFNSCALNNDGDGVQILGLNLSGTEIRSPVLGAGSTLQEVTGGEPIYIKMLKEAGSYSCYYRIGDTGAYSLVNETPIEGSNLSSYAAGQALSHINDSSSQTVTIDWVILQEN